MQLESLIGSISTIDRLEEQGGTSIVYQVITKSGTYLLKALLKKNIESGYKQKQLF
jgi:hypothetical protein